MNVLLSIAVFLSSVLLLGLVMALGAPREPVDWEIDSGDDGP